MHSQTAGSQNSKTSANQTNRVMAAACVFALQAAGANTVVLCDNKTRSI